MKHLKIPMTGQTGVNKPGARPVKVQRWKASEVIFAETSMGNDKMRNPGGNYIMPMICEMNKYIPTKSLFFV